MPLSYIAKGKNPEPISPGNSLTVPFGGKKKQSTKIAFLVEL